MLGDPRLLLVDDDAQLRQMLRRVLERHGYAIVGEAENGRLAVEAAMALHPDVVLMDLNMPEMNGIEATRHIKETDDTIEIIFLSAYADDSLKAAAAAAGASAWILKGSRPQELLDALETIAARLPRRA